MTDELMTEVAQEYMRQMGLTNTPYIVELEELEPFTPNAVISISYIRSFFLCNEYVTNHFIHFSDGSLAVAARLDCECKYTKIQASSQVQGFDLEIFKPVRMTFITAFIERRR